jgi:hypothetical protein
MSLLFMNSHIEEKNRTVFPSTNAQNPRKSAKITEAASKDPNVCMTRKFRPTPTMISAAALSTTHRKCFCVFVLMAHLVIGPFIFSHVQGNLRSSSLIGRAQAAM